jgi:hypothetical protein
MGHCLKMSHCRQPERSPLVQLSSLPPVQLSSLPPVQLSSLPPVQRQCRHRYRMR